MNVGLKLASEALRQVVSFETEKFVDNMHDSLKHQMDAAMLNIQFRKFFSHGGSVKGKRKFTIFGFGFADSTI